MGVAVRSLEPALGWEQRPWALGQASAASLITQLLSRTDWDLCHMNGLTPAECVELTREAHAHGLTLVEFPSPVAVIRGLGSYAEFLKRREAETNAKQRRTFRRIEAAGLEFRTELTWEDIEHVLNHRRMQLRDDSDYTQTDEFRAFFRQFREAMKQEGRLVECGLFKGQEAIAYDSGFWIGRVFHTYQTAHIPEYRPFRPGIAVFEKVIARVLDQGCDLIEFMGAGRPYFNDFTRDHLDLRRVVLFSRTLRARTLGPLFRIKNRRRPKPAVLQSS